MNVYTLDAIAVMPIPLFNNGFIINIANVVFLLPASLGTLAYVLNAGIYLNLGVYMKLTLIFFVFFTLLATSPAIYNIRKVCTLKRKIRS